MQTVLYDGSFEGWLCAVFDVYYYKFTDVSITTSAQFNGNVFEKVHEVTNNKDHSDRVWKGLQQKLSEEAQQQVYRTFLSEIRGIETTLLQYAQYAFSSPAAIEKDFSHPAVLTVFQTSKKVWREKHRMEAFVRFQKTGDGLFYAIIEPDFNVLPIIMEHFTTRYADQPWLIYDAKRRYGIHYDGTFPKPVEVLFAPEAGRGKEITAIYDEEEAAYQQLWQAYFKSVNIAARKNTRLHLQHMPRRYWKYLPEKQM